ncbi:MAG: alanine--tRNA ligase [Candidatus Harrisonbacteria bacterium]|nr:alanine--tRNA ligase [Candidatus Harrisonbacteria bacterium]
MKSEEIRKRFLKFFEERGHTIVSSSSLVPDDPSVLLTTAGMQQFKPYYVGKADPMRDFGSRNTASAQKCFRTSDIDEVGDQTHLTFFEMLGNFSFGGYFKKEAIRWAYEFIVNELGVSRDRLTVTIFAGDPSAGSGQVIPEDKESYSIWHKEIGLPESRIKKHGRQDNFWGPTGNEGPCGPTTEIYVDGVEIWNLVFNEYYCKADKTLEKLPSPGVDTGMGLERLAVMLQGAGNVFETDLFHPLISKLREVAPKLPYETQPDQPERILRILADHLRASIFLIADGVRPSNKEAGYILRRLLRRILVYGIQYDIHADLFPMAVDFVKYNYGDWYPEIKNTKEILTVMLEEKTKFEKALALGVKEIEKYESISAKDAFYIYETFGLPWELLKELVPAKVKNLAKEAFEEEFKKHQEISRAGLEKKFGGHGLILDTGELKASTPEEVEIVTRLHTATHLLQAALRKVLGPEVKQMGSDITAERTRFDFSFNRKLTDEEIKKVEDLVNEAIQKDLPVSYQELPIAEAKKTKALYFFKEKYPEQVKVYSMGEFSKEFCGGPHVTNTLRVGKFKIAKQEAVGSGIRRIRGVVE